MNIMHLRYVYEIAKTSSISQAAENLFMSQPNLSRAIKELETSLNIEIFERSSKGMTLTSKGEEFLHYAKKILNEVDEIENLYSGSNFNKVNFSISVPRSSYIAKAFTEFARKLEVDCKCELYYKETNALRAIRNILSSHYNLGIIRYLSKFDNYFRLMLKEKDLVSEIVNEFQAIVIMSKEHALAYKDKITSDDLLEYVEIAHADPYVPDMPMAELKKIELPENINKRIFTFERASQFTLLETIHSTYMWGSRIPNELLVKHNLVERVVKDSDKLLKDVLIYKKNYKMTEVDKQFLTELIEQKRIVMKKINVD
ncbi:MAG: LysR family transcriptional regulator [Candidatus Izemoplasmatales bacterium]